MKLLVMGTGPFAAPLFGALVASPHEVLALVTRPTDDSGRRKDSPNPMRDAGLAAKVPIYAPADVNDRESVQWIREQRADVLVVCDYGQILSADCLAAARLGGINLHASLLPKYRGAAPIQWALYHGEPRTGVSIIHMNPKLDAGAILEQFETPIAPDETAATLEARLGGLGASAALAALDRLSRWDGSQPLGRPQDSRQASRAPRIRKNQGKIDWSRPASALRNQIRAFTPWPGSFTEWRRGAGGPVRLIVHEAQVVPATQMASPGTVIDSADGRITIACGEDFLAVTRLQTAGKRILAASEFLRGTALPVGTRLG